MQKWILLPVHGLQEQQAVGHCHKAGIGIYALCDITNDRFSGLCFTFLKTWSKQKEWRISGEFNEKLRHIITKIMK